MSTQANDRRWWSVFTLAAVAVAALLSILVCALLWWMGPWPHPVVPPTAMPTAASTTAPTSTAASVAPTQPVVPAPTNAPKATAAAQPAPTLPVTNIIDVVQPTLPVTDIIGVLQNPAAAPPQGESRWGNTGADLEVVDITYTAYNLRVYVRNNGPADMFGGTIGAQCSGEEFIRHLNPPMSNGMINGTGSQTLNALAGSIFIITVPVSIDTALYYYPAIQCGLSFVGDFDGNLNNNVGLLNVP